MNKKKGYNNWQLADPTVRLSQFLLYYPTQDTPTCFGVSSVSPQPPMVPIESNLLP